MIMRFTSALALAVVLATTSALGGHGQGERWLPARQQEVPLPDPIAATESTIAAASGDGELLYFDSDEGEGEKDVIVLLHSSSGTPREWAYQFPALVDAGYRVIAPSFRGAYGTTAPPTNVSEVVEDVMLILDTLEIDTAHVMGTAFGAGVSLRLALAYPERFATLTVVCPSLNLGEPSFDERLSAIYAPEFFMMPIHLKVLGPAYRFSNPDGLARWREIYDESPQGTGVRSTVDYEPDYAALQSVTMPVHFVAGAADLYFPAPAARENVEQFSNSK